MAPDSQNAVTSSLTTNGGTWINWQRLISVALGFLSTVWFSKVAQFINTLFQVMWIRPLNALGDILGGIVRAVYGAPALPLRASFRPAVEFVAGLGVFAFPAGVLLVSAIAYVLARRLQDG